MTIKKIVIFVIMAGFLVGFGVWLYFEKPFTKPETGPEAKAEINHLIAGVPYNGFYNLYFQQANSTAISSIMDILGYWGDKRFSLSDIKEKFPLQEIFSTIDIKDFFEENGYLAYRSLLPEEGDQLEEIKKFVNPEKNWPVIIFQKCSLNPGSTVSRFRVVIGLFDKDQKVIVHDHYFGNNYEISYDDFENMFQSEARAILAVLPSDELNGVIEGPDYQASYPARLEEMDKVGNLLTTKALEGIEYLTSDETEKGASLYKEFVDHVDFKYLPAAFQVSILSFWANHYINSGQQADEAIRIITERVLPLNHDLAEPIEGWFVPSQDKLATPYFILAKAYLQKDQRELALQNYEEMKKIEVSFNQDLYQSMLEELEAELFQ